MLQSAPHSKQSIDYSLFGGAETVTRPGSTPSASDVSSGSTTSDSDGETLDAQGKTEHEPDFLWMMTEEPHRSRRMAILKAHPEIRKLMGRTKLTFPLVLFVLACQFSVAYALRNTHPLTWKFMLIAYAFGGTANQNIFLSIHEITHNLAFKSIRANKLLAMAANLSIGVPYAMAFKGYHIEHHKFLGEDGIDTDLPSRLEAIVLNNVAGKTFFATFQILFYALRPGFVRSQTPTLYHALNFAVQIAFDALVVHFFGWYPMFYFLLSSFFAGSLHPCAAHFIAEHYLMSEAEPSGPAEGEVTFKEHGKLFLGQETTSYYGWMNILCYNVGYHNEHHDFPSVPWTRLPALRATAREFYDPLGSHPSWPAVTWKFITDPSVGMWCRAKRQGKGERLPESLWVPKGVEEKQTDVDCDEAEELAYASDTDVGKRRKAE